MTALHAIKSLAARALVLAPLPCLLPLSGVAQEQKGGEETLRRVDRFNGAAKLKSGVSTKDARVTVKQVSVPGKQRVDVPLDPGFHLITLRAGQVTASIDGKDEKHATGDFWTVKDNLKMSVTASGEAAVLEVMSLAVR